MCQEIQYLSVSPTSSNNMNDEIQMLFQLYQAELKMLGFLNAEAVRDFILANKQRLLQLLTEIKAKNGNTNLISEDKKKFIIAANDFINSRLKNIDNTHLIQIWNKKEEEMKLKKIDNNIDFFAQQLPFLEEKLSVLVAEKNHKVIVEIKTQLGELFIRCIENLPYLIDAINNIKCFLAKDEPLVYKKINRITAAFELFKHLVFPHSVNQGDGNICGAASLLSVLVHTNPLLFVSAAIELAEFPVRFPCRVHAGPIYPVRVLPCNAHSGNILLWKP